MVRQNWIRNLFVRTPRTIRKIPARRRPSVEVLEGRIAPATFTVLNNADTGAGSLRAAVDAANAGGGNNTIIFAPGVFGQTITLSSNDTYHPFAFGPTALVISAGDFLTIEGSPIQNGVTISGGNT